MAKKPAPVDCPEKSSSSLTKKSCCSEQKIALGQSDKTVVSAKPQIKETKQNFDVLFLYTLVKNWFGTSDQDEEHESKPSPGLFVIEALILLLQQFRI